MAFVLCASVYVGAHKTIARFLLFFVALDQLVETNGTTSYTAAKAAAAAVRRRPRPRLARSTTTTDAL